MIKITDITASPGYESTTNYHFSLTTDLVALIFLAKHFAKEAGFEVHDVDEQCIKFTLGYTHEESKEFYVFENFHVMLLQIPKEQPAKSAFKHQPEEMQVMVDMYSSTQGIAFLEDVLLAILDIEGGWCMYGHEGYTGLSKHQQTDAYAELAPLGTDGQTQTT